MLWAANLYDVICQPQYLDLMRQTRMHCILPLHAVVCCLYLQCTIWQETGLSSPRQSGV